MRPYPIIVQTIGHPTVSDAITTLRQEVAQLNTVCVQQRGEISRLSILAVDWFDEIERLKEEVAFLRNSAIVE